MGDADAEHEIARGPHVVARRREHVALVGVIVAPLIALERLAERELIVVVRLVAGDHQRFRPPVRADAIAGFDEAGEHRQPFHRPRIGRELVAVVGLHGLTGGVDIEVAEHAAAIGLQHAFADAHAFDLHGGTRARARCRA